jgi:hypothetical protein
MVNIMVKTVTAELYMFKYGMLTYVGKAADYSYILQGSFKSTLHIASRKLGYFHQYPDIISRLGRKKGTNKISERQTHSSAVRGEM